MFQKIKAKLKSRAGLSLTEMLVTVLVLMFFSAACLLGITTALKARQAAIKAADADILSSTIMQYISNEMRLSLTEDRDTSVAGKFTYKGGSSDLGLTTGSASLFLDDEGRLIKTIASTTRKVLNDSAYNGLKLKDLIFSESDGKLTCSFIIKDREENEIKHTEFTVTPIN